MFKVIRESAERTIELEYPTKRAAFTGIGYNIVDNGHGTKAEAQQFAAAIKLGTPATFGPYTFTLAKA